MSTQNKRLRAPNFTTAEGLRLCSIIERYKSIVENKTTDGASLLQKQEAWIEITNEFNASGPNYFRSIESLQNCYKKLKQKAKKQHSTVKMNIPVNKEKLISAVEEIGLENWDAVSSETQIPKEECETAFNTLIKEAKKNEADIKKSVMGTGVNEHACTSVSAQCSANSSSKANQSASLGQEKLDSYVIKTNATQKHLFDLQVARYFYATNTPFLHAEHEEFKKLISMLHPGYVPPNRINIGGKLLDDIFEEEQNKCKSDLENKTVCLSIDGWSNIRNDPIVCSCVTTNDGKTILVDTIDTTDNQHTADYLETVANSSIQKVEQLFNCKVRSVVSDNAANMAKMRRQLQTNTGDDDDAQFNIPIITYACSAHILNLLAKDLEIPDATGHVLKVIIYFRNNHFAHAKYSLTKANSLVMPQEVRWNTMCDSLKSYIKNWPILMQIADENKEEISSDIRNLIQNMNIKRNAEDLVARLEPISKALDKVQSDNCTISDSVLIWKELIDRLEKELNLSQMKVVINRYRQAMTSAHYLAYMVNPKLPQEKLSADESDAALKFLQENYGETGISLMSSIIRLNAKVEPFTGVLFDKQVIQKTTPIDWWVAIHNMKKCITEEELDIIKQLLCTVASSAGVERIFSAFNLVHTKIRNRLGTEKAAKLVFLLKRLN